MHGVTAALVSFLLVCVVFPSLVRNRPQYYAALAAVCLIIVLDAIGMAISPTEFAKFRVFAYTACAFLQVAGLLLLFLAAGGISWRELAGDMAKAYEVIRRGEEDKEIIIPPSGPTPRHGPGTRPDTTPQRAVIDAPRLPVDSAPAESGADDRADARLEQ